MVKAVLLDVIAQTESERGVHLRLLARDRLGDARRGVAVAGRRQIAEQQLRLELRGPGEGLAVGSDHHAAPIEDQLVLATDHVAESECGAILARPLGEHPLARPALAAVIRRSRRVHDHAARPPLPHRPPGSPDARCPRRRLGRPAHRPRSRRAPCPARSSGARRRRRSWADRTSGRSTGPLRPPRRPASCRRGEGEDRSVDRSARAPQAERSTRSGKPTRATIPSTPAAIESSAFSHRLQEVPSQHEVLRRVAGDTELGQEHELSATVTSLVDRLRDQAHVALDVAHRRINLGEREAQGSRFALRH